MVAKHHKQRQSETVVLPFKTVKRSEMRMQRKVRRKVKTTQETRGNKERKPSTSGRSTTRLPDKVTSSRISSRKVNHGFIAPRTCKEERATIINEAN